MYTAFEPNFALVIFSILNFLVFIGIIVGAVWTIRRLRSITDLEQRISDIEAHLASRISPRRGDPVESSPPAVA